MKRQKLFISCMLFIYSFTSFSSNQTALAETNTWPKGPSVYAEAAIVMEASTGLILYEKNIHDKHYPASITKIMTTLLAIENSTPGEIVTFSHDSVYKVEADSSRLWIDVGEQLTMQQCYYSILLESANDVAYATAEHIGGGSIDTFLQLMNDRAKEIGTLNTNFMNPHGLHDDNHYTTAYDMALITREAITNEMFRKVFAARTSQIPPTNKQVETRYLRNHHKFILKDTYRYDSCTGGKTGYTSKSKYTLVTTAKKGDLELIAVVMRDDTSQHQYTDTQALLDFGFDNFSIYPLSDSNTIGTTNESPFFTKYNSILNDSSSIQISDSGFVVLPNTATLKDAQKSISFYTAEDDRLDPSIVGTISYTYQDLYVGGADIIYKAPDTFSLSHDGIVPETTVTPTPETTTDDSAAIETPEAAEDPGAKNPATADDSSPSMRPVIIAIITGVFAILIILYILLVERPRLMRKKAYHKRRANRRYLGNNDYLDL